MVAASGNMAAAQLMAGHAALIAQNPWAGCTIWRQVRSRQGGGYTPWVDAPPGGLGPYTVRVFVQRSGTLREGGEQGALARNMTWGMALPPWAAFQADDGDSALVRMEISHPTHGRMRITSVTPLVIGGQTCGWLADLEAIR